MRRSVAWRAISETFRSKKKRLGFILVIEPGMALGAIHFLMLPRKQELCF